MYLSNLFIYLYIRNTKCTKRYYYVQLQRTNNFRLLLEDVFNKFLKINNYTCVTDIEITEKQMKQYEKLQNQSIRNDILYSVIPLIIDDKIEIDLKQTQIYEKATRHEKLQLEKYYMLQKLNDNIFEDYQSQLFDYMNDFLK